MNPRTPSIMIVEDEALVAEDMRTILSKLGYDVCCVTSNREDTLNCAKSLNPDVALMDIRLEGNGDGIDTANELDIPVIYVTAYADDETLTRAKNTNPYGYILKPFRPLELKIAVELALRRTGQTDELIAAHASSVDLPEEISAAGVSLVHLRQNDFLRKLDDASLGQLLAGGRVVNIKQHEVLAEPGDQISNGFCVLDGRVALVQVSGNGKELIVELVGPGDVLGIALALSESQFSSQIRAQMASTVLLFPRDHLYEVVRNQPQIYEGMLTLISERLEAAFEAARALAHDRVEVRIASALVTLARAQTAQDDSSPEISIKVTRQDLASITGTTVETAIRVTKNMEREGVLNLCQTGVVSIKELAKLQMIARSY